MCSNQIFNDRTGVTLLSWELKIHYLIHNIIYRCKIPYNLGPNMGNIFAQNCDTTCACHQISVREKSHFFWSIECMNIYYHLIRKDWKGFLLREIFSMNMRFLHFFSGEKFVLFCFIYITMFIRFTLKCDCFYTSLLWSNRRRYLDTFNTNTCFFL